jgi:hypothetical protein
MLCAALIACGGCANAPDRGAAEAPAAASTPTTSGIDLAQLEDIFWTCDYVATTQGVLATPARECAAATRELRQVKFGGSFQRLLEWWREHKPAEHGKRRAAHNDSQL